MDVGDTVPVEEPPLPPPNEPVPKAGSSILCFPHETEQEAASRLFGLPAPGLYGSSGTGIAGAAPTLLRLSLIHISEPTRLDVI
eukprot:6998225-Prorocentrum_lima.AAC.1